jgi:hypothetical protein
MAGMAVLVLVPLIYGIIALNTGDWLWFSPVFDYQPSAMTVYCFGEKVSIPAGSDHFSALVEIVNQTLSGRKRWDSLTMSDETYREYQTDPDMMVVELAYPAPIRVHSRYKYFSNVDKIIIPLLGRHAQTKAVFGRRFDFPAAGSFHVETTAPIMDYLVEKDLCTPP